MSGERGLAKGQGWRKLARVWTAVVAWVLCVDLEAADLGEVLVGEIPTFTWTDGGERSASRKITVTMADVGGGVTITLTDQYTTNMGGVHSSLVRQVASLGSKTPTNNSQYTHNPNESGTNVGTIGAGAPSQWWWVYMNVGYWNNGTFTSNTVNFWFRSELGGGTAAPAAPAKKQITVSYYNDKPYPVLIKLMKDGVAVGSYTVAANTLFGQTVTNLDPGDYQAVVQLSDAAFNDGVWVVAEGAITTASTTPVPAGKVVPTGDPVTAPNTVVVPTAPNLPASKPATNTSGGTVWRVTTGNSTTDGLTNSVFREGIDKITTRQDTAAAATKRDREELETAKADWAKATTNTELTRASGHQASAKAAVEAALGTTGVSVGAAPGTGSSSMWQIPLPGGGVANLAPWADSGMTIAGNVIKAMIAVVLVIGFTMWFADELGKAMRTLGLAPQSRGNTVAGTGGQVTGAFAAAAITFIILGVPVVLAGLVDSGLGWKTTTELLTPILSHGGAYGQGILDLVGHFFPVLTLTAVITQTFFVKTAMTATLAGAMIAIRWIVPGVILAVAIASEPEARADVSFFNSAAFSAIVTSRDGLHTVTLAPGNQADLPLDGSGVYLVQTSGVVQVCRVIDSSMVAVLAPDRLQVATPSRAYVDLYLLGFVVGVGMELFGLMFRLLGRAGGSVETP